ncbi:heparinase II/III family protein (plasmid) [Streptomyces sp. NBC_00841]|uniref:heparinase II/III family protein n=1 Tax=Streptomyces sp. NBC_00841 TaxID=2975847 RepID=UPI002DDA8C63|nr:heparinase II/III family protein [Streptomyces sp. NBC_00841]WSA05723.1 heparinase II/III family protein [Streptomyces sp. NBC_00841]
MDQRHPLLARRRVLGTMAGATAAGLLPLGSIARAAETQATSNGSAEDAGFFGIWDGSTWTTQPRLDYTAAASLKPVEDAARAGDYAAAGEALRKHFRSRTARAPLPFLYNGIFRPGQIPLFIDHIWTLGTGEIYQDVVTVTGAASTVFADVTEALTRAAEGKASEVMFFLMARDKEPSTAVFASRDAGAGAPVLEVTKADGSTVTFPATADTYIKAGDDATRNFGSDSELQVRDEGVGAFTAETRKAYLAFRIEGVTQAPRSARLKLTGRNATAAADKRVIVFQTLEAFNETTRTWANTVQNTFSRQGDPGGFDWKRPAGADPEYGYQLPRLYFAGPMADAYRQSGDETIAAGLTSLITDFIRDADSYGTAYGAGSFPRSLDTGNRIVNWVYAYESLRTSPSLTAADNTAMLRTIEKSGRYLAVAPGPNPNWIQFQKQALTAIAVHFPEFRGSVEWLENARTYLSAQFRTALYPDGGYVESTDGYAWGVVDTFGGLTKYLQDNGYELGGKAELDRLVRFLADQNLPGGFSPAYGDSGTFDRGPALLQYGELLGDATLTYIGSDGARGTAPDHTSVLYPDTRVAVQRSGWRQGAAYLRINADRGPHSHPDDLAVTVWAEGNRLLPDMGAFTYSNDPRSNWLRFTTESHSTVEVDATAQKVGADASIDLFATNAAFDLTRAWTDGNSAARHTRTVLFVRPGLWIVSDHLRPSDTANHVYRQNWQLLPEARPALEDGSRAIVTDFAEGGNLRLVPARPSSLRAEVRNGYYSPVFYSVTDSKYVTYTREGSGLVTFDALLLPVPAGQQSTATVEELAVAGAAAGEASAMAVTFSTGRTATYAVAHTAPRSPIAFGAYTFDGMVAYAEADSQRRTWLLYGGCRLATKDAVLVDSPVELKDFAVRLDPARGTVAIDGMGLVPSTDADRAVRIHAPWAASVTLNGEAVPFTVKSSKLLAAAAG